MGEGRILVRVPTDSYLEFYTRADGAIVRKVGAWESGLTPSDVDERYHFGFPVRLEL